MILKDTPTNQKQPMTTLKLKLNLARIIIRFLDRAYLGVNADKGLVEQWTRLILKRESTRGPVDTVGWIKAIRLASTRFLCGEPLKESPGFGISLDESGLPHKEVFPLVDMIRNGSRPHLRYAFTCLGLVRLISGSKAPDLTPITMPAAPYPSGLEEELLAVVKELGWKLTVPEWERPHVTTKSGPNAQALAGSIEDASLLTDAQIRNLGICGGEKLVKTIGTVRLVSPLAWCETLKITPKGVRSRLSYIKDKEAKTRIVAILDYWTQSCFEPLHNASFGLLRSLKPDCTFNQGSFRTKLPRQGPYYSCDLSSATDRLPVTLQRAVLAVLISPEYASAWYELLCDRDFQLPRNAGSVRYGAGQPMGAYSSWTTFAITHHAIVRLAAKRAGLSHRWEGYVLLGDDIVLTNDAVAKEYMTVLDLLGVEVSKQKTHVSKSTYEFAKRWIHLGEEVTGAPLGSLFEAFRFVARKTWKDQLPTQLIRYISFYEVATWIREVEARWLPRTRTLASRGLIAELFRLLGRGGMSYRLAEKAWKFYLLPSREDSKTQRAFKREKLGLEVLGGIFNCFSFRRAPITIGVLLNECKARVLESALKRQMEDLTRFQLELVKFQHLVPEGLDAQTLLFSLPPFAVLIRNISELQLEFDKAHKVRDSADMMQWLHLDVRLFLDPFATLSTRRNKTVAATKATILNHFTAMCRGIEKIREIALTSIDQISLWNVIYNLNVLPTRGGRKLKGPLKEEVLFDRNDPDSQARAEQLVSVLYGA